MLSQAGVKIRKLDPVPEDMVLKFC
jgi:hypothetical protein